MSSKISQPLRPFASCHDGHLNRRTCMLMVTHGCNLNCTYCYEKFKNGTKQMSADKAREILSAEIETVRRDGRFSELEVDFMGGEPLLCFNLIKELVEWLEAGNCDVPFVCFASTNGTLLTDEMKQWFREHRDSMVLGASYDGLSTTQSVNRGEASTQIDLDFFRETWPMQGFKMTLSKESLPYLFESYIEAASRGMRVDASLAHGVDWDLEDAKVYSEQLHRLKDFYLEHPGLNICNLLSRPLGGIGDRTEYQARFCGSGVYMATYDVDGTLYGCHLFTPIVLGSNAVPRDQFAGWDDKASLTDASCRGCGLTKWCPTCIGFNLKDRGDICRRDHRWCAMVAAQALCACEFQIEYFTRHMDTDSMSIDEAQILKCAVEAYDYLRTIDFTKPFPQ